jgi:hypothetical protein
MYDITNMSELGMDVFFAATGEEEDREGLSFAPADLTREDMEVLLQLKNKGIGYDRKTWAFILEAWQEEHVSPGPPRWGHEGPDYEGRILDAQVCTGEYD